MTLEAYLKETGESREEFAKRIGVSAETIRRYLTSERRPDRERMEKIALATGCKVTANDFFGIAA